MRNIKKQAAELCTKSEWCEAIMVGIFICVVFGLILVVFGG